MNPLNKTKLLISNPVLRNAYLRWLFAKLRGSSVLNMAGNFKLGGWLSFSEYWSFQVAASQCERLFIKRCLSSGKPHPIAFDVGANIGVFTCLLAASGAEQIHAFEPIPSTFCRLKANIKVNGQLGRSHLNCLAVGKEPGLVTFHVQEDSPSTNRIIQSSHKSKDYSHESLQRVATTSLDTYCQETRVEHIDLLKIDVEGMEPYVLQGARTLLKERRIAAVLIEICPVNLRSVGFSPADLYREFEAIRYFPHALNDDGNTGEKLSLAEIEAMTLTNVVLLPDA